MTRPPLLLYLAWARDPQRFAVAPALAAAAERAGWGFECYYDAFRAGRHFGGGDPAAARPGWPAGSLVAGGRHADHAFRLAARYEVAVLGDPASVLWPALAESTAEELLRSSDPAELYEAAFSRLELPLPATVLVVDGSPQRGLVLAPYLYPRFLAGPPALGLEASGDRAGLERLGAREFVDITPDIIASDTYASITDALAREHASWGRGVLLGDPDLVAAQLPKARRLRLLPLYGQPQTDVIERAGSIVFEAREPIYGRQYDDRDFFRLSELGHGLQVLDPDPPFDAEAAAPTPLPDPPRALWDGEPTDDELRAWAADGRVLVTLLFWVGMIREAHCLPRLIDLVAATGLRCGFVVTSESLRHAGSSDLALLGVPPERGGVGGLVEPLLGSTGFGVAAEAAMPSGALRETLERARSEAAEILPAGLRPRGWWPLLDTPLKAHRESPIGRRGARPVIRYSSRGAHDAAGQVDGEDGQSGGDARGLLGSVARRSGLMGLFEERRPFADRRPGPLDRSVADAVRAAGFEYMWSKAGFGEPRALHADGDFVALPFTAGNWDGWSPFYTAGSLGDLKRAEKRLRGRAGWLASTIDSPLFALPGELLERGSTLYGIAELAARGGASGELVNVTPNVVARYALVLYGSPTARADLRATL